MIFEKEIGISIEVSACIGAILLVLTGVISEKDALNSIDLKNGKTRAGWCAITALCCRTLRLPAM